MHRRASDMPAVVIIDTCVFLNILNIDGFNQHKAQTLAQLEGYLEIDGLLLILPFAAIIETGNHIAHLTNGETGGNLLRYL